MDCARRSRWPRPPQLSCMRAAAPRSSASALTRRIGIVAPTANAPWSSAASDSHARTWRLGARSSPPKRATRLAVRWAARSGLLWAARALAAAVRLFLPRYSLVRRDPVTRATMATRTSLPTMRPPRCAAPGRRRRRPRPHRFLGGTAPAATVTAAALGGLSAAPSARRANAPARCGRR